MLPKVITKTIKQKGGKEITIETGKLAKQADGSVVVKMGNTMLLATVVSSTETREGFNFLPLSVDYQEKFAAAGRIPGGFLKREGRLSDYEVLICRLVDRAIRPLFPNDYRCDTQINISLISGEGNFLPDCLAALAASAALMISDIPFNGPISEVRVTRVDGQFVINPTVEEMEKGDMSIIVAASMENILMVEGEMDEVSEDDMLEAMKVAHEAIKEQCKVQKELETEVGSKQKREYDHELTNDELKESLFDIYYQRYYDVAKSAVKVKKERKEAFMAIKQEYLDSLTEEDDTDMFLVDKYFGEIEKKSGP